MTIPQSIGKSNLSVTSTPGTSWHGNSPMPNVISSTQCCGMWMWWIFDVYIYYMYIYICICIHITYIYIYTHCTYQLSNLAPLGTTLYEVMLTLHVFFFRYIPLVFPLIHGDVPIHILSSFELAPCSTSLVSIHLRTHSTGCWLGHPSEKYEVVNWDDDSNPIFLGTYNSWQPNHQPVIRSSPQKRTLQ